MVETYGKKKNPPFFIFNAIITLRFARSTRINVFLSVYFINTPMKKYTITTTLLQYNITIQTTFFFKKKKKENKYLFLSQLPV